MRLEDKIAIVTGAAQGIGKGIALALSKEGAKLAISDINDTTKIVNEIRSIGYEPLAVKTDVSNYMQVQKMVKKTIKKYEKVDILVNNAGIYPFKPLIEIEEKDWDKVININLKGVFNYTKAVLPIMVKQRNGSIINISSMAGTVVGWPDAVHYCASKGGVLGFTKGAGLELAQYNIRVNAIAPAAVDTPSVTMGEEAKNQVSQLIPLKRWGVPTDIANLVIFLASDESNYITGQLIVIDGGFTLQ